MREMMKNGKPLDYLIVRVVPDPLRGEILNVALLGVFEGRIYCSTVGRTRCLAGMLDRSRIETVRDIPALLRRDFSSGYPVVGVGGLMSTSDGPSAEFLSYLCAEGWRGFYFDEPRMRAIRTSTDQEARAVFKELFEELVAPRKLVDDFEKPHVSRAKTIVNGLVDQADGTGRRIAKNIVVRSRRSAVRYSFDFAFANGKATLAQTLDFDTLPETQLHATDHVIATRATVEKLVAGSALRWLSVVRTGASSEESGKSLTRLAEWGDVVCLPEDDEAFRRRLESEASSDVRSVLESSLQEKLASGGYELVVPPIQNPTFA